MYYELTIDAFCDYFIDSRISLPPEISFIDGGVITEAIEVPLEFYTNATKDGALPDFWGKEIPVMSQQFVELLEKSGVDSIQKFPVTVKSDKDGTVWHSYFAVNILDSIKCADLNKSIYTEIFPGHYRFKKLGIDSNVVGNSVFFRLQENMGIIIIHKSILEFIVDNDPDELLTGWEFEDIVQ